MPSGSHPQAQFVPIPPDLDLDALVENTVNFDYATRLSHEMIKEHSIQHLEQLVLLHVVIGGKPLVIENWGNVLDPWLFNSQWLQDQMGKQAENVRDIANAVDVPMTIGHYLRSMPQLANQFTPANYRDSKRQRLYLKDIDCPDQWAKELEESIPETFFYLNNCIESRTGGDGAVLEPNEYGQMGYGKGVAPSGDLMSSLPPEMRALNMMCYIGHEGTYTPAHREMCASLGHNIMVEASKDGNGEKAGSSIWFMTETKEREVVSEYFLSMLGHDIEVEKHFAQVNAWKKAPFNVWVVEQKPGDLILIPPLAPHQVWNRGTRTMKAAWNRTTVDTLELALHEALPRARLVCREEQYKNKAIIYYTLLKYNKLLQRDTIEPKMWRYGRIKQLLEDFKRLFALYTEILVSEMFASNTPTEQNIEFLPYDSNVTCSYCRCNIFNRFLTCKTCIETGADGEEDTYDICMECYAMGRSCGCISNLNWVEQWEWSTLTHNYEEWRNVIVQCDGYFDIQKSPQLLDVARKRYGRTPVAHICQEQLKSRPWHDISKPFVPDPSPGESDVEPEADDLGRPKKKPVRKAKNGRVPRVNNKTHACHICCHHDWNWRLAFCTTCNNAYCYGVLWRAFDLMPQTVMEDRDWSCPKCQAICSCGKCRKNPTQKPYAPKGTLLGHDTKQVADVRSVECLVDFSRTNLGWLRGENDHNPHQSARMKKLKEKAEEAKAREDVIDENYFDDGVERVTGQDMQLEDDGLIDPVLRNATAALTSQANDDAHYKNPNGPTNQTANDGIDPSFIAPKAPMSQDPSDNPNDYFDTSRRLAVNYPSALFGSVSPVHAPEQTDTNQVHLGQNRMMGIGFYKQGNGVDKILYDPPNSDDNTKEPQSATISTATNFALSDILQTLPQNEGPKKRRHGSEGDEVDTEFFTSKRQKKLSETKRPKAAQSEELPSQIVTKTTPSQRPPRLSAGKPQTYLDLGEDSEAISDSEIVQPCKPTAKRDGKSDAEGDKHISHPARPKRSKDQVTERRNVRGQDSVTTSSPAVTKPARRKSREKGQDTTSNSPAAPPRKRGRPRTKPQASSYPDALSSDNRNDAEDLLGDDDPDKVDVSSPAVIKSARRKSREKGQDTTSNSPAAPPRKRGRPRTKPQTSSHPDALSDDDRNDAEDLLEDDDPEKEDVVDGIKRNFTRKQGSKRSIIHLHVLQNKKEPKKDKQAEKPAPKSRGRPRKSEPTPAHSSGPPQLLSLKEKLALKGKSAKIVASKIRQPLESPASIPKDQNTVVTAKTSQTSTTVAVVNPDDAPRLPELKYSKSSVEAIISPVVKPTTLPTEHVQTVEAPVRKHPTVVRLSSPSSQSDEMD